MTEDPGSVELVLPLPNGLAYGTAVLAVVATVLLPFAFAAGDLSFDEVMSGYYAQSAALFSVLGSLILWRRPGHLIGWTLVAIGGFDFLTRVPDLYELFGLADRNGYPPLSTIELLAWMWVPTVAGIIIWLPQLVPDGRLLSRRWRPLAWFGAVATVFLSVVFLIDPDGYPPLVGVAFLVFALAGLASVVPLVLRYRRSTGAERQQLKWVFYGLAISVPMLVLGTSGFFYGAAGAIWAVPPLVVIPVTITVAVLRYRLYDIDVVISRTLLVAGLAGFITVTYVAIVVGIGSLVGRGDEPNLILSIAATALVAVAFQPVRRRLQRVANRLVFGRRATPYDVLSGFATRVGVAEASPETLVGLAELMSDGTGAQPARVWLRVGSHLRSAATWPPGSEALDQTLEASLDAAAALPDADLAVPVQEADELLGVLTIAKPRGERVTEVDVDLVERLAAASGVLLRNLRLDAELAERLGQIEASRQRLVGAQDEARRRIEAELGGGTRAQLRTLREQLEKLSGDVDPEMMPKSAVLLGQLVASTNGALDTLASLAAGVYPPRLAADGLVAALTEQTARAAVPVQMHESGVARYPADVEAAVYFAVLEALQNVAKYADATHVRIRLSEDQGTLTFEVSDDGAGFDTAATTMGTGLQGIVDRLDTVDGTVHDRVDPGEGHRRHGHGPDRRVTPGRRRRHSGGGDPMSTIVRRATFASWVICMVAALASFVLLAMGTGQSTPGDTFVLGGTGGFAFAFAGLAFGTVGALISHRIPDNNVGWVFSVIGLGLGVGNLVYQYADQVLYGSASGLPGGAAAAVLQNALVPPVFGLVAVALMIFPDGRLPSRRWWPAAATALVGSTGTVIGYILRPGKLDAPFETVVNPFGAPGQFALWENVSAFGWPLMTVGTVLAAAAMRSRLKRSHGLQREQLKWVAFAASIAGLMIVLDVVSFFAAEEDGTADPQLVPGRHAGHRVLHHPDRCRGGHPPLPALRHRRRDQQDPAGGGAGRLHHGDVCGDRGGRRFPGRPG